MDAMNDPVMEHLRKTHFPKTVTVTYGGGGHGGTSTWSSTARPIIWAPSEPVELTPKPKRTPRSAFAHLTSEQCCYVRRAVLDAEAEGTSRQVAVRAQARKYGISTELVERIVAAC